MVHVTLVPENISVPGVRIFPLLFIAAKPKLMYAVEPASNNSVPASWLVNGIDKTGEAPAKFNSTLLGTLKEVNVVLSLSFSTTGAVVAMAFAPTVASAGRLKLMV